MNWTNIKEKATDMWMTIFKKSRRYIWKKISQIRYSLVVILELNGVSEVQYKDVMMIDNRKYQ